MKIAIPLLFAFLIPSALLGCSSEESDGPLKASDSECRSGRSLCEYRTARKSELCSDCRSQCVETLGADCNSARSCKSSCSEPECDASDLELCSDDFEEL